MLNNQPLLSHLSIWDDRNVPLWTINFEKNTVRILFYRFWRSIFVGEIRWSQKRTANLLRRWPMQRIKKLCWPHFLEHENIPIFNKLAENVSCPFAVARKNWLFPHTTKGAGASAIIYSMFDTITATGHDSNNYLLHTLSVLLCYKNNIPWNVRSCDALEQGNSASRLQAYIDRWWITQYYQRPGPWWTWPWTLVKMYDYWAVTIFLSFTPINKQLASLRYWCMLYVYFPCF